MKISGNSFAVIKTVSEVMHSINDVIDEKKRFAIETNSGEKTEVIAEENIGVIFNRKDGT